MADEIRCPMCSKNNPAGTETCRHCGARLTSPGSSASTAAGGSTPSDPNDWLKGLRTNSADDTNGLPGWQDSGPGDDIPDWLADVRGISESTAQGGRAAQPPADDLPDWMSTPAAGATPPAASAGNAGLDEWLSSLREPEDTPEVPSAAYGNAQPDEPAQQEPAAGDDWLANLQPWTTAEDSAADAPAPAPSAAQDDLSAWLESLDTADAALVAAESAETALPPAPLSAAAVSSAEQPAPEKERSLEDWLSEDLDGGDQPAAPQPSEIPPAASGSVPQWLSSSASPDQDSANAPTGSAGEELPDWLSGFASADAAAPATQPAEEIPAWMNESAQAQPPASPDLPDWISAAAADATPELPSAAEATPSDSDANPPWFNFAASEISASGSLPEAPAPAEQPDFEAMFAENPSDETREGPWMENIQAQIPPQPQKESVPAANTPSPAAFEPSVPDWLAAFAVAGTSPGEPAPADAVELPFIDPQQPAWLNVADQNLHPAEQSGAPALFDEQPQAQPDMETGVPFKVDLPDWLDNPQLTPLETEAEGIEDGEKLAQADLPGWVQDMRPLEAVLPGQEIMNSADQQRIEKAGPLVGMRGVLQPEEPAAHFRKLPAYSSKLRVSERQHLHAGLLQNVIDVETQPSAVPAEPSSAPQTIYRLLIAVVIILALLFGLIFDNFGLLNAPLPSGADRGVVALFNEIESVSPGVPVLVAFDYEAALAGEMRFAASSVLEHLMARGAKLVIVSTVPTGPVLANDLLVSVHQGQPVYDLAAGTINLGYLPGGAISLLEFAQRPNVAAPVDQNGNSAWKSPVLQNIQTIQDFKMVLVLTDSVETGRAWVEQVQPLLGSVPLTMVSSAQAGALLLPYFDAGQIKGLVNGLMGAVMYEQHYGKSNLASKDWNAYQLGYSAGILLLILGGVFSALRRVAKKPQKARV